MASALYVVVVSHNVAVLLAKAVMPLIVKSASIPKTDASVVFDARSTLASARFA